MRPSLLAFVGSWAVSINASCAIVALPLLLVTAPIFLLGWLAIRDEYFEEKVRDGDRVLYRLRDDKLAAAASDARLGLP